MHLFYLALYVDGTGSNGAGHPFSHALVGKMTNTFLKARTRRLFDHRAAPRDRSGTHSAFI